MWHVRCVACLASQWRCQNMGLLTCASTRINDFVAVSVPSYSGRTLPYINPWYNPWAQVGMQTKSMILETFFVEPISIVMLWASCRHIGPNFLCQAPASVKKMCSKRSYWRLSLQLANQELYPEHVRIYVSSQVPTTPFCRISPFC